MQTLTVKFPAAGKKKKEKEKKKAVQTPFSKMLCIFYQWCLHFNNLRQEDSSKQMSGKISYCLRER